MMRIATFLVLVLFSVVAQSDEWGELDYKIISLEKGFEATDKTHKVVKAVHCKYFSKKKQTLKEQNVMGHLFKESADLEKLQKVNKSLTAAQSAYCSPTDGTNPTSLPGLLKSKCRAACRKEFPKDKGILDFSGSEKGLPCESLCNSYVEKFEDFAGAIVEAEKLKEKNESVQDCSEGVSNEDRATRKTDFQGESGSSRKTSNQSSSQ